MTLTLGAITFDCSDALRTATFWGAALDRSLDEGSTDEFSSIGLKQPTPGVPAWLFARVPEPRQVKNRAHPDLIAPDRATEVARLVDLGATVVAEHDEFEIQWTVLRDVEDNEFCVAGAH
ncbi:VOC family protein [Nocardioides sp. NPDC057577]|uniref:VOC family protein n=1 Tax=Nocardioides sp. NPDC057577 TaxID=3346171 RepID=UPI00366F456C